MDFRYYIEPQTGLPHILSHGVTEAEVQQVFLSSSEEMEGKEGTKIKLGQTLAGRYLKVIFTRDMEFSEVFVITAYELKGKAKRAFRRRRRGRLP